MLSFSKAMLSGINNRASQSMASRMTPLAMAATAPKLETKQMWHTNFRTFGAR